MQAPRTPIPAPQSPPCARPDSDAYEDAVELARALQWLAEHPEDALWTVAELRELEMAAA